MDHLDLQVKALHYKLALDAIRNIIDSTVIDLEAKIKEIEKELTKVNA